MKKEYEAWHHDLLALERAEIALIKKVNFIKIGDTVPLDLYDIPERPCQNGLMIVDNVYIDYRDGYWWIVATGRRINDNGEAGRRAAKHHIRLTPELAAKPPRRIGTGRRGPRARAFVSRKI